MYISRNITSALTIVLFLTASCGSRSNREVIVKPETTKVSGDLSDYITLTDGEYQVTQNMGGRLSIKVKALQPLDMNNKSAELRISFLSGESMPISGLAMTSLDLNSVNSFQNLLKRGSGEEIVTFMLVGWNNDIAEKAKKFTVTSELREDLASSASIDDISPSSGRLSSTDDGGISDQDFDKLLDDYEKSSDGYIKMVEGMDGNDPSKMVDGYADALTATLSMETNLKDNKANLNPKQMNRLLKIQGKMLKAMSKSNASHASGH